MSKEKKLARKQAKLDAKKAKLDAKRAKKEARYASLKSPSSAVAADENPASAFDTPQRPVKPKKPFYMRWWFYAAIVILIILIISGITSLFAPSIKDDFNLDGKGTLHGLTYKYPSSWTPASKNSKDSATYTLKKDGKALGSFTIAYSGSGDLATKPISIAEFKTEKDQTIDDYEKLSVSGAEKVLYCTTSFTKGDEPWVSRSALVYKDNVTFAIDIRAQESAMDDDTAKKLINGVDFKSFKSGVTVRKLSASYFGPTKAGTAISDKSKIVVYAKFSNGADGNLSDWHVTNPQKLATDKTSIIKIKCQDKTAKLKIVCSTMSKSNYMAHCKTYSYSDLTHKSTGKLQGALVKATGKVTQVIGSGEYLIDVGGGWDFGKYVHIISSGSEGKVVEDDTITVYGKIVGDFQYETVLGANKTIPEINAKYINR